MDLTASSTVLDTVLFVLLVGAAVGVLSGIDPGASTGSGATTADRVADESADVFSTSTANVTYSQPVEITSGPVLGDVENRTGSVRRTVHGTYAELLATAVVASPHLAGEFLVSSGGGLKREAKAATTRQLPSREANVQVRAVWRPYGATTFGNELSVGDGPPADAEVSATAANAPSGFPNVTSSALESARADGFRGVAAVVARGIIEGLFPPVETEEALYSEGPDRPLVAQRYRDASDALDVAVDDSLGRRDVREANEKLSDALADPLREDLSRNHESAEAAARTVRIDRVRIVVRAWSS